MGYAKKILSIPIIILILLFTVSVSYAGEVRAFKADSTPAEGNPYPTLKAALDAATSAAGYDNGYITVLAGESYTDTDTPVVQAINLTIYSTGAGAKPKVTINNGAKYALQDSDKPDLIVQNVDFSNAGGISIRIEANTASVSATFSGCSIYSSGASGITTAGTGPVFLGIDNCYFNANNSSGTGSQAGLTWNGTGADSLLTVANSLFNDNKNADVLINGGAPVVTISDTHFSNTQAGVTGISRGAATGSLTVKRCLFRYADANAAAIREEAATSASRMTIFGNIFWSGYGIRFNTAQGNAGIYHNVFYKNAYAIRSASADTPCIAKNNIFYASTVYDYDFNTSNPAALTQDHNCHYNTDAGKYASDAALRAALVNTSVSHNVLADPLLKGSAADLYKYGMWVSDGSPCINAGTDLSSADPAFKILLLRNARWKETETGAAYICTGSTDNTGEYGTGTPVGAFLNQKKFYLSSTGYDTAAGDYDGVKTHRCLKTIAYISQAAPDATHLGTEPGDTYYSRDSNTIKTLTTSSTTAAQPTTTTSEPRMTTTVEPTTSTILLTTSTTTTFIDSDGDGIPDSQDNCPGKPNGPNLGTCSATSDKPGSSCTTDADCTNGCSANGLCIKDQRDADTDGTGDVCDCAPLDTRKLKTWTVYVDADGDGNGAGTTVTICGGSTLPAGYSTMNDDGCPNNSLKTAPGICGCGVPDTDSDGDGVPDCIDNCPNTPNGPLLGTCIQGSDKAGSTCHVDADCVNGCSSNGKCSLHQEDTNTDGKGDVCSS